MVVSILITHAVSPRRAARTLSSARAGPVVGFPVDYYALGCLGHVSGTLVRSGEDLPGCYGSMSFGCSWRLLKGNPATWIRSHFMNSEGGTGHE